MAEPDVERLMQLAPSEEWRQALRAAPRHWFVPDVAWTVDEGLIDRQANAEMWWRAVANLDAIVTQIDDGASELTAENVQRTPNRSSSCSAPEVVLDFLRLLDPYPGDRVLEIGTGTGWTTALLCAYLGADRVTSIEVDEQIAAHAKANLEQAGFGPTMIVGDGVAGSPEQAPFDRVHVTAGTTEIPYTWAEQTRPGGVIVAPWTAVSGARTKVRLTVTETAAVGRFTGGAAYMMLRGQRPGTPPIEGERRESVAHVDPRRIEAAGRGFRIAAAGMLPDVHIMGSGANPVDGTFRLPLREVHTGSHALAVQSPNGGRTEVTQTGTRDLWNELESAYLTWVGWGEPATDRFGLTVDASGQHVWLDSPDNQITEVER